MKPFRSLTPLVSSIALLLAAVAVPSAALAQSSPEPKSMTFNVTGTRLDGGSYKGTADIVQTGPIYAVAWKTGVQATSGLGIESGESLAVGWGSSNCVVVGYQLQDDGSLKGEWISSSSATALGTETLTPATPGPDISGNYTVAGTNSDKSTYKGTLVVTPRGPVMQFSWKVGSSTFDGVGIQKGKNVAVGYGSDGNGDGCGVALYEIGSDLTIKGVWGLFGQNASGTETWTIAP